MSDGEGLPVADELLFVLNGLTPADPSGLSVTLLVGGAVVSGRLVPADTWVAATLELLETHAPPGQAPDGQVTLHDLLSYATGHALPDEDDVEGQRRTAATIKASAYLHLLDANVVWPSGMVTFPGPWRGRISEVQGWSFAGVQVYG